MKIKIFCASTIYRKILDKMPKNIVPFGVGNGFFPNHWLSEKDGKNIIQLNKHYGEHSCIYWVWKNYLNEFQDDDWIGFCHYRKFWLNDLHLLKQKYSFDNLYNNFLKDDNSIFKKNDVILVQPIIYSNKNLFQDFQDVHKTDILKSSLSYLNNSLKSDFESHLNSNILYPLNMFIVKKNIFIKYCENVFPWLEKCMNYCDKNNLLIDYNIRLPSFLSERFVSFWFSAYKKKNFLSYARLGKFFLSDYSNIFFNSTKLPLTFRMYPNIHKY